MNHHRPLQSCYQHRKVEKNPNIILTICLKGLLVKRYMHVFPDDNNHSIVFGPNYGDNDVLMLGNYPMHFDNYYN